MDARRWKGLEGPGSAGIWDLWMRSPEKKPWLWSISHPWMCWIEGHQLKGTATPVLVCLRLCEREEVLYLDAGQGSDVSSFHIVKHHWFCGCPSHLSNPQNTVSFNSGIATGSLQESGIEKDDIQTMFNVLDANNSGEAPLWLALHRNMGQ